jgi:uncharacterized protein YqjF (DUF2071 family)
MIHMTWNDLLFMHWPVPAAALRSLIPSALELDLYDGRAWIGVVPFLMTDVRPSAAPRFLASNFPELNVRTYVRYKGRSGVWFCSLDAAHRPTVWGARRFFHLPYHFASMSCVRTGDVIDYRSRRRSDPTVELACRYRPIGEPRHTAEGELDHWLTARYCLFSANAAGEIFRCDVRHPPWRLQPAEAEIERNTMTAPLGIQLPAIQPLLHFGKRGDVEASLLRRADSD